MSKYIDQATLPNPKVSAEQIGEEWPEAIRTMVKRDGNAVRGPLDKATIEIKSTTDNVWRAVMLPGNGFELTTIEERDAIIRKITR